MQRPRSAKRTPIPRERIHNHVGRRDRTHNDAHQRPYDQRQDEQQQPDFTRHD